MKATIKTFIIGLIVGAVVAFPLGINFGRGESLLSNPFVKRDISERMKKAVKEKTGEALEGAKERLHEATKPAQKEMEDRMER